MDDVYSFMLWCVKGNKVAADFVWQAGTVAHFFDDLIDNDRDIGKNEIHSNLWLSMITLPRNEFYRNNFNELNPLVASAILNWRAANELEATVSNADKEISFIIRSEYVNLLIHSALLVGGVDWAAEITPKIRRFWHDETLAGYKENLANQFAKSGESNGMYVITESARSRKNCCSADSI